MEIIICCLAFIGSMAILWAVVWFACDFAAYLKKMRSDLNRLRMASEILIDGEKRTLDRIRAVEKQADDNQRWINDQEMLKRMTFTEVKPTRRRR